MANDGELDEVEARYKAARLAWNGYSTNLYLAVWTIFVLFTTLLQVLRVSSSFGFAPWLMLVYAIYAHVVNHRLKLSILSPILIYVAMGLNVIGFLGILIGLPFFGLLMFVVLGLEIAVAVLSLQMSAAYRKAHPTYQSDYVAARAQRKAARRK